LRRLMRKLVEDPETARRKGRAAQRLIATRFSRPAVTKLLQEELAHCREMAAARPSVPGPERRATTLQSPVRPTASLLLRDPAEPVDFRALLDRPLRVRWEGDQS